MMNCPGCGKPLVRLIEKKGIIVKCFVCGHHYKVCLELIEDIDYGK